MAYVSRGLATGRPVVRQDDGEGETGRLAETERIGVGMERSSFDLFKSNVCHRVKELGDWDFIIEALEKDEIRMYYDRKWYAESFYLLAMLDYLSRLNDVPLCSRYNDLRSCRLQEPVYPASVLMTAAVSPRSKEIKEQVRREAIPEFMRFNLVESDIRNVV